MGVAPAAASTLFREMGVVSRQLRFSLRCASPKPTALAAKVA